MLAGHLLRHYDTSRHDATPLTLMLCRLLFRAMLMLLRACFMIAASASVLSGERAATLCYASASSDAQDYLRACCHTRCHAARYSAAARRAQRADTPAMPPCAIRADFASVFAIIDAAPAGFRFFCRFRMPFSCRAIRCSPFAAAAMPLFHALTIHVVAATPLPRCAMLISADIFAAADALMLMPRRMPRFADAFAFRHAAMLIRLMLLLAFADARFIFTPLPLSFDYYAAAAIVTMLPLMAMAFDADAARLMPPVFSCCC